jgi:hypothetical protein
MRKLSGSFTTIKAAREAIKLDADPKQQCKYYIVKEIESDYR